MATVPATTSISESQPKDFEIRSINFPKEEQEKIREWLHAQIESLLKQWEKVHKHNVAEWRRIIDGEPRDKNKSWPFPNCSNLVVPLVGEIIDEVVAWVIQLIFITQPLCMFRYPDTKDEKLAKEYEEKQKALADFFDNAAFDPLQLNIYPYMNRWFTDAAGMGKAHICIAPENRIEAVYTGYDPKAGKKGGHTFEEKTIHEGPKLINCRYEDILVNPNVDVFEENDPIVRRVVLTERKIRERVFKGHFKEAEAKKILESPDRYGPDETRRRENQKEGITDEQDRILAEWDIYECYFSWWHNGRKFRLISWYHMRSKTSANDVFNFMPDNNVPIIETRLTVKGTGYAKMLKYYQEEASTGKNQLTDAITFGMLGVNTIDKQNKDLDRNFTLNPGVFLPAKKDTFQHYDMAEPAMAGLSLQNLQQTLQQAKARAGVDPPIGGTGAGTTDKKGKYGSMGTMAILQTSNSRSSHRTSGFRHSSVKLYSRTTDMYGAMGLGDTELVKQALRDYIERKIRIPVRAADASMNKEVTKQSEIILNQFFDAYIKQMSQLLQAYENAASGGPEYKKNLRAFIMSKRLLFAQTVKDFQLTDHPLELVPEIVLPQEEPQQNAQPQQPGATPINALAAILQRRGQGNAPAPGGNVPATPGGLPGAGGGPPMVGGA
jgi:hypothetical protein